MKNSLRLIYNFQFLAPRCSPLCQKRAKSSLFWSFINHFFRPALTYYVFERTFASTFRPTRHFRIELMIQARHAHLRSTRMSCKWEIDFGFEKERRKKNNKIIHRLENPTVDKSRIWEYDFSRQRRKKLLHYSIFWRHRMSTKRSTTYSFIRNDFKNHWIIYTAEHLISNFHNMHNEWALEKI